MFFVNAGPSLTSAFYVTGVLFDTVYKSGNPADAMHGLNTLAVPPSDGAVFEFRVTEPGDYPFMDLNRAQQYKGATGSSEPHDDCDIVPRVHNDPQVDEAGGTNKFMNRTAES